MAFALIVVTILASLGAAFPKIDPSLVARVASQVDSGKTATTKQHVEFNPAAQLVDVTGKHAWRAPDFANGDQRGPCPGLNALANHGYLPRTGITPWTDIATMTTKVFGLGSDISSFLAFYGAVFDGNLSSYSIGGPDARVRVLGHGPEGLGLSASHDRYESDASSARFDLYTGGNDYKLDLHRFKALYKLQPETGPSSYDLDVWRDHRKQMFLLSVHENPEFFYAPFAGVIGSTGGFTFPPRMMSNKSAEHPNNGILDREILKTFFSVSGASADKLEYTFGHERIPANFYKRAIGNEYIAADFFEDLFHFAEYFPEMISVGGNTGKVDSYAALDISNLTGGVYNSAGLLKGNNLECFVTESVLSFAPDILRDSFDSAEIKSILSRLVRKAKGLTGGATCPQITKPNKSQFRNYPGARKSEKTGIL